MDCPQARVSVQPPKRDKAHAEMGRGLLGCHHPTTISNLDWRGGRWAGGEESEINVSSFLK